jgi:hypothetical protein
MSWCTMVCSVHVGFVIEGVGWGLRECETKAQDESVAREGSESSVT